MRPFDVVSGRLARVWLALAATVGLVLATAVVVQQARADTAPPAGTPATVSADGLPTWQINGVGWSQVVVGNTVYVGGNFTAARPPGSPAGTNQVTRTHLLAYDIRNGSLITSFNHTLNGQVLAVAASPDGTRLYAGGGFTRVDGLVRNRIAAFDIATGALVSSFAPSLNSTVQSLAVNSTTVYAGGAFSTAGSTPRSRAAAFSATTGALTAWNPNPNSNVLAMSMSPDGSRVMMGGRFTTLGGQLRYGLGAVDRTTGLATAWTTRPVIRDAGNDAAILSLVTDGTKVYGTGYVYGGGGNFEGRFAIDQMGYVVWLDDCHGDSYSAYPIGDVVYSVSHSHDCTFLGAFPEVSPRVHHRALAETSYPTHTLLTNNTGSYANFGGQPAPTQLNWYPTLNPGTFTGQNQAAWSVTGNAQYVALAGEFPSVNGVAQQGLVRFAVAPLAPNKRGPLASTALTPTLSLSGSTVTVRWGTTSDTDNGVLTYRLYRDSGTTPIATTTADTRFWTTPKPTQVVTDNPGSGTHTYKVVVSDPFGNTRTSATSAPVTVSGGNAAPRASFTFSCTALTCSFDGRGSSDSDGSIASYAWTFGDGSSATGATVQRTYAAAGNYTVTLTVKDNLGATGQASQVASVSSGTTTTPFAFDSFNRTVTNGLGTADTGGAWTPIGSTANLSVSPGTARLNLPAAGANTGGVLTAVPVTAAVVSTTFGLSKLADGTGAFFTVAGRRIDATHEYRGIVRVDPSGAVRVSIAKLDGSSSEVTIGTPVVLPGVTYAPGSSLRVRFSVVKSGTSTALSLTVWPSTAAQPSPQVSVSDSTVSLQSAGGVGIRGYLSGSATNAPVAVLVSSFSASAN